MQIDVVLFVQQCCIIFTTTNQEKTGERRENWMSHLAIFGDFFREKRLSLKLTLREFCRKYDLDPGNISKLERGILQPPESESILEKYAEYLNIEKHSEDWYKFFDLASTCNGTIPSDVMSDEELVKRLPLVFRTLRGQKVPEDKLDELAEKIRRT